MGWMQDEARRLQNRQYRKGCWKWAFAGVFFTLFLLIILVLVFPLSETPGTSVIRVEGTIVAGNFNGGGYVGSEYIGRQLRNAADDPLVEAIVLRINSPGGSPSAAQEIIRDIEYARGKKPVVSSMGDIATSAAYHIASHTDLIYANPDTITGSIGTIWTFFDYSGQLDEEGIGVEVIKSGEKKDIGSTYRPLSDEERVYVSDIVNQSFELFISDVIEQRGVERSLIEDAGVIRGDQALKIGLVDRFGNLYDAIDGAKGLT